MNLRLRDDQEEALKRQAQAEGRTPQSIVQEAVDRFLEQEGDRATVRRLGAKYEVRHADPLRRPGE
ncbi:CopG family transcriptional regulator [Streptomyces niveus]|uniref:CopG family transcriptional regulator n=2 Tax=Streptomyces niveus TaxID=193462 RepID=A0A1U9R3Q9_STRNV|nr:CopG family transcriptional regulator [Streptomyces niveus]